jgi:hypothetical protein
MASAPSDKITDVPLVEESIQGSLPPPGRYRHFKGDEYEVVNVARHSETDDWLVVYFRVDDPERLWVRPVPMFLETVNLHGCVQRRFEPTESGPLAAEPRFRRFLSVLRFRSRDSKTKECRGSDSGLQRQPHTT